MADQSKPQYHVTRRMSIQFRTSFYAGSSWDLGAQHLAESNKNVYPTPDTDYVTPRWNFPNNAERSPLLWKFPLDAGWTVIERGQEAGQPDLNGHSGLNTEVS